MDSFRGKHQHSFRAYKANSPYGRHIEANYCNTTSSHGIFRSRIQKHSLKWKKDYYCRGNYRSRFPYKKNDINYKKSNKTAEDEEEEERKRKLNDTAKQLLSKIKTWNAEKNCSEDNSHQNNISEVVSENNCKPSDEKINSEGKPKRIAHSKKTKLVKSWTRKSFCQPRKISTRYDVNKETVKDFQNRIQHKLIEEIMQMPRENLQNVLNDPKINPIMEKKMSRLVKENRPLIAQKLRALAEAKMQSLGYSTNPELLDDIDKLIDPVIETDLSVLPYELIKQMENIFQVQFDYSSNNPVSQVENNTCENTTENVIMADEIAMELNNFQHVVKMEVNEDFKFYECSTDDDEELSLRKSLKLECNQVQEAHELIKNRENIKKKILLKDYKQLKVNNYKPTSSPLKINANMEKPHREDENIKTSLLIPSQEVPENPVQSGSNTVGFASRSTQTDCNCEDALTQTETITKVETLYGIPLPKEATDENVSSLLDEVNSIQTLVNKLNERRLMIFLQLARTKPLGSFISNEITKNNFIESISNGNVCLMESLKEFFSLQCNNLRSGSSENGYKLDQ